MIDKNVIQQVLGCLIKRPQLLSEVDKYSLTITDFPSRFERCIFAAIGGLYHNGAPRITPLDIANFLESDSSTKVIFEGQNGIEYLQDIEEFSNVENFSYYYHKLKKLNLLRDLKKQGMDTDDFYIEDLSNPKAIEVNSAFEELTTKDIINGIKRKLLKLESDYGQSDEVQTETIAEGIDDLIDNMAEDVNIGQPIQGDIYNQVINGAEPGALTIRSGSSGLGKTRQAVGDACLLAYPIRYNPNTCEWEQVGSSDKVLFIVTEQTIKQVRKMILAYLTGINESKFKFANFTNLERELLNTARDIIKEYEDNFIIIKAPNPTIELIKTLVRENCLTKGISHVFYDYIFIGPALLNEFRGFNLRNDEVLLMFATALKDLAVELEVTMMTSTQVNASADDNKNIRNEASLSGGRSTINKADNGAIMARPTKEELDALSGQIGQFGKPNMVTDIFKVRSGEWTQVRIWSIVDLGILRKEDLFITDSRLEPIEGFFIEKSYTVQEWDDEEFQELKTKIDNMNRKE